MKQERDWEKVRIGTLPVERKRWSANVVARGRKKKRERELKGFVKFRNQEFHGVHCQCLESK